MGSMYIKNLEKNYGKKKVLNGLTYEFTHGIYGILGPNGAGKTTLMKCILGLEKYEGSIEISEKEKRGYLPQNFSLFRQLKVMEAMEYIAILKKAGTDNLNEILEMVNLGQEKDTKIKNLSGGMLRRFGIAQALVGNPDILIIDEPTVGLDPKERVRFRNLLAQIQGERVILLSSHIVEDMEAVCDEILIIKDGRIIISGNKEDLIHSMAGKIVECEVKKTELGNYRNYNATSITYSGENALVRFVGDHLPEGEEKVATLEDVYFYYAGESDGQKENLG